MSIRDKHTTEMMELMFPQQQFPLIAEIIEVMGLSKKNSKKKFQKDGHIKKKFSENVQTKKKKDISNILESIPKSLTQIGKLRILCAEKSQIENNPATSAPTEKIIVLYDSAMHLDTKRIITHELAHMLYESLSKKELKSYWGASGWDDNNIQKKPTTRRTLFSAQDGVIGPDEDFANNIEY